ncbi:type I-E CRISPR-associated protein Cas5/CasD [Streptomyces sp. HPF1205]|uniref:type I-E CRISPR-associated protein Cas5/CasD n=1 Tax=Streptomyces sp. HPF1205 TaxID=2873262 RepID=UPI001CECD951|nr:type I-E CRISPR-associated protein Cas5/CasD [Streptomyces sp. HPF1205]
MTGFLLQLGAPLQSWGEHSAFTDRDTVAYPTRSGLIGMVASALGIPRAETVTDPAAGSSLSPDSFADLRGLRFTVRIDRPGTRLVDFHTVGGGYPHHRTVPTAKGARRSPDAATIVSRRHYLSDAVFTVAVTGPGLDPARLGQYAAALAAPHWPLHLGRRSCPPSGLLLVRAAVPDPVAELDRVPLARPAPRGNGSREAGEPEATVEVRFTADTPFPQQPGSPPSSRTAVTMLNDEPVRHGVRDRVHQARPSYTTSRLLPASLCAGYGIEYLEALANYLNEVPTGGTPS